MVAITLALRIVLNIAWQPIIQGMALGIQERVGQLSSWQPKSTPIDLKPPKRKLD